MQKFCCLYLAWVLLLVGLQIFAPSICDHGLINSEDFDFFWKENRLFTFASCSLFVMNVFVFEGGISVFFRRSFVRRICVCLVICICIDSVAADRQWRKLGLWSLEGTISATEWSTSPTEMCQKIQMSFKREKKETAFCSTRILANWRT